MAASLHLSSAIARRAKRAAAVAVGLAGSLAVAVVLLLSGQPQSADEQVVVPGGASVSASSEAGTVVAIGMAQVQGMSSVPAGGAISMSI